MPEHLHRLGQGCHNAAALGLPGTPWRAMDTEAMTNQVRQAQRPETEPDDPLAARSAPSPEPTLADAANCPKQEPCESIRITT